MKIAIAGAGIGGLAAAAGLARQGHQVTVFDQFAAPAPVGSGLVIQPVGQRVLDDLGIDATRAGARIHRLLGHCATSHRRVLDVSYDAPGDPRFGLGIHRASLFALLLEAAQNAGARVVPGHRVVAARDGELSFADQPPVRADWIVDACGARSPLSPLTPRALPFGALWATVDWPDQTPLPRNELRQVYRRADKMLGVLPMGPLPGRSGKTAAIFWSLPAGGLPDWQAQGLAAWQAEATALWPDYAPFVQQITDPGQMTLALYAHGTLRRPFGAGIVQIGDAAHCTSPQLGQGANMALLDAAALTRALSLANGDPDLAGQWYADARRWHLRLYQGISRLFTPQYQSHSRVLPVIRDRLLFPLSQVPPVARLLTRMVCGDLIPPLASLRDRG